MVAGWVRRDEAEVYGHERLSDRKNLNLGSSQR